MDDQNCWMRAATTADAAAVAAFAEMTFRATYGDANTPEDMELYCRNTFSESLMAADISMPDVQYQLAIAHDVLVGFIKLQWSQPPIPCLLKSLYKFPASMYSRRPKAKVLAAY